MKDKLESNMYVRTKQGYIAKFKEYDEIFDVLRFETPIFLRSWVPCDYMQKERFMNRYFLKASYNIIDLIEVGDYLNGFKVSKIERYDTKTIIKIGNSTFNVLEGEEIYWRCNYAFWEPIFGGGVSFYENIDDLLKDINAETRGWIEKKDYCIKGEV